jgi:hypothetical protein
MVPGDVPMDQPIELDLTLPAEIREHGMLAMRFTTRAIRKERLAGLAGRESAWVGMVARLRDESYESQMDSESPATGAQKARSGKRTMTGEEVKFLQRVG